MHCELARKVATHLAVLGLLGAAVVALPPSAATTPAELAPSGTPRPSGMPWASGVFAHSSSLAAAFQRMRGAPVDVLSVHPSRGSWARTLNPWWLQQTQPYRTRPGVRLELAMPHFAADLGIRTPQAGQWRKLGQLLVSRGEPDAILRLGWEMGLPQWGHACTRANRDAWVARWREAVRAMRSVPGQRFRFAFVSNEGRSQTDIAASSCYPGNAFVDMIGMNVYDKWPPIFTDEQRRERFSRPYGLNWWFAFAKARDKKFAIGEWGVSSGTQWAGHAGGDNPYFVTAVFSWLSARRAHVGYENYFDEPAPYLSSSLISQNPRSRAAYRTAVAALR